MTITHLPTLPVPTWTKSDNNLLPKWVQYLAKAGLNERQRAIQELNRKIERYEESLQYNLRELEETKEKLKTAKAALKTLEAIQNNPPTDADIMERYEAIITSPHVIGTRLDSYGDLVVLVQPHLPEIPAELELGVYEVGREFFQGSIVTLVSNENLQRILRRDYTNTSGKYSSFTTSVPNSPDAIRNMVVYDFETAIKEVVAYIQHMYATYKHYFSPRLPDDQRAERMPWSGYNVEDPVRALKRLLSASEIPSLERTIRVCQEDIREQERYQSSYVEEIRSYRKELRTMTAERNALVAVAEKKDVDLEEARQSLEYISNLEGVIAIAFQEDGTPTLHVRNSIVVEGHRYDLGDFELHLKLERFHFGTVLMVRRTRVPLGGSYEQGWHSGVGGTGGFCFGNRNTEIINHYQTGDIAHAVNVAIGTMNSIDEVHVDSVERMFQEIPMNAVWTRHIRRRPRRRTAHHLGRAALELTEVTTAA